MEVPAQRQENQVVREVDGVLASHRQVTSTHSMGRRRHRGLRLVDLRGLVGQWVVEMAERAWMQLCHNSASTGTMVQEGVAMQDLESLVVAEAVGLVQGATLSHP